MLLIFAGCRKEVDYDFVNEPTQIVVESFICPTDDTIKVNLNYTKNYFDQQNDRNQLLKDATKATVTITNGTITKTLKWSPRNIAFILATKEMPLLEDATYTLSVLTLDGKLATATTKIPKKVVGAEIEIKQGSKKADRRNDKIILKQVDEKAINNFYEFRLVVIYEQNFGGQLIQQTQAAGNYLVSDENDKLDNVSASFNNLIIISNQQGQNIKNYYRGIFIKSTEEYFKYLEASKKNNEASGNPFAEPVSLFTNINGGVGVFASYQIEYKKVDF